MKNTQRNINGLNIYESHSKLTFVSTYTCDDFLKREGYCNIHDNVYYKSNSVAIMLDCNNKRLRKNNKDPKDLIITDYTYDTNEIMDQLNIMSVLIGPSLDMLKTYIKCASRLKTPFYIYKYIQSGGGFLTDYNDDIAVIYLTQISEIIIDADYNLTKYLGLNDYPNIAVRDKTPVLFTNNNKSDKELETYILKSIHKARRLVFVNNMVYKVPLESNGYKFIVPEINKMKFGTLAIIERVIL